MADGRRHSVDLPIAKTLVVLRRVRSLRDPSTHSMSKFSSLVDNINLETIPSKGISLPLLNSLPEVELDNKSTLGAEGSDFNEHENDLGIYYNPRKCVVENISLNHIEEKQIEESDYCGPNQLYCCEYRDNELDLIHITPSSFGLDDIDFSHERIIRLSSQAVNGNHTSSLRGKSQSKNRFREVGDLVSRVSSPCLSIGEAMFSGSSHGVSSYANGNIDAVNWDERDYGISCCWSRTPRFSDSNCRSDEEEDNHLLPSEVNAKVELNNERRTSRHVKNEIVPYVETARSLSQKFRPKSFNDLVGHNVVAISLLNAICKGRITPFYIFHGPRGTGKTSAARIFAAALNCLSVDGKPCGVCRECVLFFDGKSKDVNEVDSVRINRKSRLQSFIRSARNPPLFSRFKIFIIDECQILHEETWATILDSFGDISQNIIFIMITADFDKVPRSAVSRSQKYHFPKIKEADIANKLEKISIEEGLDYDLVALEFVAAKSNGSLRDAEMMLDQLSLFGKRITIPLAYELIGIVPDDELLDLLDLALSSDTSNTVKRAREMMKSRVDPMQLISQLANLIMDILAGKSQDVNLQLRINFCTRHTSNMQKLNHALKILSETEKQLRSSKNQMTWLTVALLQLNSYEETFSGASDPMTLLRLPQQRDGDFSGTSSTGESLKCPLICACDANTSHQLGMHASDGNLETIWKKTTELFQSHSLRNFLRNEGSISSVCIGQGLAVAELEFHHPTHVSRAEKSWKLIASSLQSVLGCNVEIRINLIHSTKKKLTVKKTSFNFFTCSRIFKPKQPHSFSEHGSDPSNYSNMTSEKAMIQDNQNGNCGPHASQIFYHRTESSATIRSNEGNALSNGRTHNVLDGHKISSECGCEVQEVESQPRCFCGIAKKVQSLVSSQMICLKNQPRMKHVSSISNKKRFETYICGNDLCCSGSNNDGRDGEGQRKESNVHCWYAPSSFKKAWKSRLL